LFGLLLATVLGALLQEMGVSGLFSRRAELLVVLLVTAILGVGFVRIFSLHVGCALVDERLFSESIPLRALWSSREFAEMTPSEILRARWTASGSERILRIEGKGGLFAWFNARNETEILAALGWLKRFGFDPGL